MKPVLTYESLIHQHATIRPLETLLKTLKEPGSKPSPLETPAFQALEVIILA